MHTTTALPATSTLTSSQSQAKQGPTNLTDTTFNQALAHQLQSQKNGKESESTTVDKTGNTSNAEVTETVTSKENGSESFNDVKNVSEAAAPIVDTLPAIPVELLALVANINQVINKPDNTNTSPVLTDSLQSDALQAIPTNELSKESLALLDSQQGKPDRTLQTNNTSDKIDRLGERAATGVDHQIELQAKFGAIAQKIHDMATPTSTPAIVQMSQIPLNLLQASTTPLTEKLTQQVGTQGWDQALGQKIVWMVAGAQQSATLTLNPPDLGPLQIILNVTNDQADATFISAQPEVRHALEAALPKLREMMNEAGIQLSDATVSSNASNQHGAPQQNSHKAFNNFKESHLNTTAVSQTIQARPLIAGKQMVDTFA